MGEPNATGGGSSMKKIVCLKHGLADSYLKDSILIRYACSECFEEQNNPLDYLSENDDLEDNSWKDWSGF